MSEATARAAIDTVVSGVTNIGKAYSYERFVNDWSDYLDLFKVTISSVAQIRGSTVGYDGQAAEINAVGSVIRTHRFIVRSRLRLQDSSASEKTASALCEAICDALDAASSLHDGTTYVKTSAASIGVFEHRLYGSVLCHYSEINLEVTENTTYATT